ncbi:MAG: NAD(P)H-dependent glycerol-3-phosphate dehydrogenase [Candidatus Acidiferrales bacterium]|jgi:glycerol-3-phosphate dehydrogenase (NAD(P)+)
MNKIAIIGAGSWGTALAIVLSRSRKPHAISLWAHEPEIVDSVRTRRVNDIFLPGFELPEAVSVTGDIAEAVRDANIVLGVMPSQHARGLYSRILPHLSPGAAIVSATKGLEPESLHRMSEVVAQAGADAKSLRVAAMSGPSFAREVARGDPTAIVIASKDASLAGEVQEEFSGPTFRLYTNSDITGVELGGAIKNVIAIAAGVTEGLGLGHNSLAALITRGLAEMSRLGIALGGKPETMSGLAGMGDLVLTCTGALSRNRSVGVELGKGRKLEEIIGAMRMVAEGVPTTAAAQTIAKRMGIEMPITEQMHAVLYEGRAPLDAIRELMERRLKGE